MIKNIFSKKIISILFCILFILTFSISADAHPGKTDATGGHHDYKNVSGLGNYHYHCGDNPAHLHENGVCPYKSLDTITINNPVNNLKLGESIKLDCYVTSAVGNTINNWKSSNTSVATISEDGTIVAKGIGETTITISTNNNSQSFNLSVLPIEVESINISNKDINIQVGNSCKVEATVMPNNATDKSITWISSDDNVAIVDNSGMILGKAVGHTTIKVNANNGISEIINVNVFEDLSEDIEVNTKSVKLKKDETFFLKANALHNDGNDTEIIYESNNPNIATIDSNGMITAKNVGITNIIIKNNDKSITISVEICSNEIENNISNTGDANNACLGVMILSIFSLIASMIVKKRMIQC